MKITILGHSEANGGQIKAIKAVRALTGGELRATVNLLNDARQGLPTEIETSVSEAEATQTLSDGLVEFRIEPETLVSLAEEFILDVLAFSDPETARELRRQGSYIRLAEALRNESR